MATASIDEWAASLSESERIAEIAKAEADFRKADSMGSAFDGNISPYQRHRMSKRQQAKQDKALTDRFRAEDRLAALRDPEATRRRIAERAAKSEAGKLLQLESHVRFMLSGPGVSHKTGKLRPSVRRDLLWMIDNNGNVEHLRELVSNAK